MTQEDKELLLKDLCARLPYECMIRVEVGWFYDEMEAYDCKLTPYSFMDIVVINHDCDVKPYLRPMNTMTPQEWCDYCDACIEDEKEVIMVAEKGIRIIPTTHKEDYLNSRHFDHRGLLLLGLALEAPEGMYKED